MCERTAPQVVVVLLAGLGNLLYLVMVRHSPAAIAAAVATVAAATLTMAIWG